MADKFWFYSLAPNWIEDNFLRIGKISHPAIAKSDLLLPAVLQSSSPVDYSMQVARMIASHLKLNMQSVVVGFSGNLTSAASVQRDGGSYFIEIDNFFERNKHQIAACLAHEMTHVFLKDNGLEIYSGEENEKYTDLTTIALGMGVMLLNGLLAEGKWKQEGGESIKVSKRIKPYISCFELGYAVALYAQVRKIDPKRITECLNVEGKACFKDGYDGLQRRKRIVLKSQEIDSLIVLCPQCFQKLRVPAGHRTLSISCNTCGHEFSRDTLCKMNVQNLIAQMLGRIYH